jgi:hypothetical protein
MPAAPASALGTGLLPRRTAVMQLVIPSGQRWLGFATTNVGAERETRWSVCRTAFSFLATLNRVVVERVFKWNGTIAVQNVRLGELDELGFTCLQQAFQPIVGIQDSGALQRLNQERNLPRLKVEGLPR